MVVWRLHGNDQLGSSTALCKGLNYTGKNTVPQCFGMNVSFGIVIQCTPIVGGLKFKRA